MDTVLASDTCTFALYLLSMFSTLGSRGLFLSCSPRYNISITSPTLANAQLSTSHSGDE